MRAHSATDCTLRKIAFDGRNQTVGFTPPFPKLQQRSYPLATWPPKLARSDTEKEGLRSQERFRKNSFASCLCRNLEAAPFSQTRLLRDQEGWTTIHAGYRASSRPEIAITPCRNPEPLWPLAVRSITHKPQGRKRSYCYQPFAVLQTNATLQIWLCYGAWAPFGAETQFPLQARMAQ